jgi:MYXO-CTERM domain-containing protein
MTRRTVRGRIDRAGRAARQAVRRLTVRVAAGTLAVTVGCSLFSTPPSPVDGSAAVALLVVLAVAHRRRLRPVGRHRRQRRLSARGGV